MGFPLVNDIFLLGHFDVSLACFSKLAVKLMIYYDDLCSINNYIILEPRQVRCMDELLTASKKMPVYDC